MLHGWLGERREQKLQRKRFIGFNVKFGMAAAHLLGGGGQIPLVKESSPKTQVVSQPLVVNFKAGLLTQRWDHKWEQRGLLLPLC